MVKSKKNSSSFTNFMHKKTAEKNTKSNSKLNGSNKTKTNLEKARNKEKEEKDKELYEAKKESMYKASRYNQSAVTGRRIKQTGIFYIFIIALTLFFLLFVLKGLPAILQGTSSLIRNSLKTR
jgi:hypothetical protein